MKISRRNFLKSIGATAFVLATGTPVSTEQLEYRLTVRLDDRFPRYIRWETMRTDGYNMSVTVSIDKQWVQDCVIVTDQFNRRWSIIGYFEGLRSPEGWEIPLDTDES